MMALRYLFCFVRIVCFLSLTPYPQAALFIPVAVKGLNVQRLPEKTPLQGSRWESFGSKTIENVTTRRNEQVLLSLGEMQNWARGLPPRLCTAGLSPRCQRK